MAQGNLPDLASVAARHSLLSCVLPLVERIGVTGEAVKGKYKKDLRLGLGDTGGAIGWLLAPTFLLTETRFSITLSAIIH
jgi:hypothetical protein